MKNSTRLTLTGLLVAVGISNQVLSATLCSGNSAATAIDLSSGTRTAALSETIRYSAAWETSASGATAVVAVNGETLKAATGTGAATWRPTRNGTYTLTHKVLDGGTQVGTTLTTTFKVSHCPPAPVISPVGGIVDVWPVNVTISCETAGATIHYTTDGTEPTADSPTYRRLRISEPTTVKAVAIKDGLIGDVSVAEYAAGRCADPVVTAASSFTGTKTQVALSCGTEGAIIRYTLDGSVPEAGAAVYSEPFDVTNSCTVKAYASYPGYFDSDVVSFAIEKFWDIGDTMGDPDRAFSTAGDAAFFRVDDATAPLGEAMRSGAITHGQTSTMSTWITGSGTVAFQWRTSCEDSGGVYDWDHAEFEVDGTIVARLDGVTGWLSVTNRIDGAGQHTLLWRYVKDDMESAGEDCCRVADFSWTPEPVATFTSTTPEPVPHAWLSDHGLGDGSVDGYEAAALATAANGRPVWECYVADLDPMKTDDDLKVTIAMKPDGTPEVSILSGESADRVYETQGAPEPGGPWGEVTEESRFFRVKVRLP